MLSSGRFYCSQGPFLVARFSSEVFLCNTIREIRQTLGSALLSSHQTIDLQVLLVDFPTCGCGELAMSLPSWREISRHLQSHLMSSISSEAGYMPLLLYDASQQRFLRRAIYARFPSDSPRKSFVFVITISRQRRFLGPSWISRQVS